MKREPISFDNDVRSLRLLPFLSKMRFGSANTYKYRLRKFLNKTATKGDMKVLRSFANDMTVRDGNQFLLRIRRVSKFLKGEKEVY